MLDLFVDGARISVSSAAEAGRIKTDLLRLQAKTVGEEAVPSRSFLMADAAVLAVVLQQAIGTMTPTRGAALLAYQAAVLASLVAAENEVQAIVADETLSEAEKVQAIEAVAPAWPALPPEATA
jgi:hypothetical protein